MNKQSYYFRDDIAGIYAVRKGISRAEATRRIDDIVDILIEVLTKTKVGVKLTGLVTFDIVKRDGYQGVNPSTREEVDVPERNIIKARVSKTLKEKVKNS